MATSNVTAVILCQAPCAGGGILTWASVELDAANTDTDLTCIGGTATTAIVNGVFESADTGQTRLMVAIDGGGSSLEITGGGAGLNLLSEVGAAGATNTVEFALASTGAIGQATAALTDLNLVVIVRN